MIENVNIWSMNISSQKDYEKKWNKFENDSCFSIDYFLTDNTIDIATTTKVIVIQEIDAKDNEKFLITLLPASRKYLFKLLKNFIIFTSFVILHYLTFIKDNDSFLHLINYISIMGSHYNRSSHLINIL